MQAPNGRPAPGARREHQGDGPAPAPASRRPTASLGAFQTRLDELQSATSEVERRMEQLAERETLINAVRQQVDAVHEISAKSRANLDYVEPTATT